MKSRNYESRYYYKFRYYESRYYDKSRYYDRLCDDAIMQASIKHSHYYNKSRYNDRFSAGHRNYEISLYRDQSALVEASN